MSVATLLATARAEFRQVSVAESAMASHQTGTFPSRSNTCASVNMDATLDALLMHRGKGCRCVRTADAESTATGHVRSLDRQARRRNR